jgi:hypothetical protein
MGCGGSKGADAGAANVPTKQGQGGEEGAMDAAAAEIQGAAAAYMKKKREADKKAEEGSGIMDSIIGMFSQRPPETAPAPAVAAPAPAAA